MVAFRTFGVLSPVVAVRDYVEPETQRAATRLVRQRTRHPSVYLTKEPEILKSLHFFHNRTRQQRFICSRVLAAQDMGMGSNPVEVW